MQKLLRDLHRVQTELFGSQRELFERPGEGRAPEVLFITCSDSRINPNLLTRTDPGEPFIPRNAGNIVPPYGAVHDGEAATIDFGVAGLGVKDIIVCGHSHRAAMQGLLKPPSSRGFPALTQRLCHAEATRRTVHDKQADRQGPSLLNVTIQENVPAQMENLRTHPVAASGPAQGKVKLHGWAYKIETGEVFGYDPASTQFQRLTQQRGMSPLPERRLVAAEIGPVKRDRGGI